MSDRSLGTSMLRGLGSRCPGCGVGALFGGFLRVNDHCPHCGEAMHHHRADDMPPYVTTFVVGHVVVALMMSYEVAYAPPMWVHAALWLPLTLLLCIAMMRPVKGAIVGYQWRYRMHGFGGAADAHRM